MKKTVVFTLTLLVLSLIRLHTALAQTTFEHGSSVTSVAFSPDGTILASAGGSEVKLWDVTTHQNITTLEGHRWDVTSVAFSPDGTILASAGEDNEIKLWDVTTHTDIATLEGHRDDITSVAFSPDGTILASGASDSTVKLWDTTTHTNIATLEVDWFADVTSVAFSPDGAILASADDNEVKLWDVTTHTDIATLEEHRRNITSVAFSPDGTILASAAGDDEVKLWDVATHQNTATLSVDRDDIYSVSFSPDGILLASGGEQFFGDGAVKIWDVITRENIAAFQKRVPFEGPVDVVSVSFSPDGTLLASGSTGGEVKLWNITESTSTLKIISGNNQEAIIDTALANPLVIEVRDRNDNPLPGVQVTFTVTEGDGLLSGGSTTVEVTTDANGRATQIFTLGPYLGNINTVKVSIGEGSVWFYARGVSPYQLVKISGDEQSGTFGTALANPLVVEVRNRNDNPLPDVQVTFTVTEGEGLLNGESTVVEVTTDANGRAAQTLTLGHAATNTVDASIGYESVEFNAAGISPEHIATLAIHEESPASVAFSPDGNILASADVTGVKLWDVATKENTITLAVERSGKSVAFSPDGMLLAFGAGTNIKLWNTMTKENVATLEGHGDDVVSIAFSPDGKTLASGAWDGIVKLWDVATKENIATFGGHITAILEGWFRGFHTPVSFSPDGTRLAFGAGISIKLWDVTANENVAILEGHEDGVISIAFSPDGTLLASTGRGSFEREVNLWEASTGENIATFALESGVGTVAFSPDGTLLAFGAGDSLKLLDVGIKEDSGVTFEGHEGPVSSIAFSPDGNTLASGASDGTVKLWDMTEVKAPRPSKLVKISGDDQQGTLGSSLPNPLVVEVRDQYDNLLPSAKVTFRVTAGHGKLSGQSTVEHVITDTNGRAALSFTLGHTVMNAIDVSTGRDLVTFNAVGISEYHIAILQGHQREVTSVAFSPDGTRLASASSDGTVELWDVETHQNIATLKQDHSFVRSVAFSPDGTRLAANSWEGVSLWDVETKENIVTLQGNRYIHSVAFSPDGTRLAAGDGAHETVNLWDVETHQNIATLQGHQSDVTSVAFSPDGTRLASAGGSEIKLWDIATHQNIATLEETWGHLSVSFSPDGRLLASGAPDGVKLWDVESHKNIATLGVDQGDAPSVSFSPDGTRLASASSDGTVKLWDVETHQNIATLIGHQDSVTSVTFSPDGMILASASDDATIRLWNMSLYITPVILLKFPKGDVNQDGVVNIQDLVLVAGKLGQTGTNSADVNGDGTVNIQDLVLVAGALGTSASAPSLNSQALEILTTTEVKQWLSAAQQLSITDTISQRGVLFLQQLLIALTPKETALLANYPNPFNPETWIPYHLSKDADVTLHIYAVNGTLVRTLTLGHQAAGMYQSRSRAAYWDGKNAFGEPVASGVYFYTIIAGDFSATRKMLIRK